MSKRQQIGRDSEGDGPQGLVTLGRITGAYGVRGWVKLQSETQPMKNILSYSPWLLQRKGKRQQYELETGKPHGKSIVAKLVGCDDREQAEGLRGAKIAVARDKLPALNRPDEYYWADLEGMQVRTTEGRDLGEVSHLMETGANDVLVVRGDRERLVPFIREQVIRRVDLDQRLITVDWDPEF